MPRVGIAALARRRTLAVSGRTEVSAARAALALASAFAINWGWLAAAGANAGATALSGRHAASLARLLFGDSEWRSGFVVDLPAGVSTWRHSHSRRSRLVQETSGAEWHPRALAIDVDTSAVALRSMSGDRTALLGVSLAGGTPKAQASRQGRSSPGLQARRSSPRSSESAGRAPASARGRSARRSRRRRAEALCTAACGCSSFVGSRTRCGVRRA